MNNEGILAAYRETHERFVGFGESTRLLIENLLRRNGLRIHSVGSRIKSEDSLRKKTASHDPPYQSLGEITDICGIRIITFFESEVDLVAKIIEKEFQVDYTRSIDKRAQLAPDKFGYLSLHFIIQLSKARLLLTENEDFAGLSCEVQIRSILQHAWAEIEHDLGYKSDLEIPRHLRRRFSRIAGLLELADDEFVGIQDQLRKYRKELQRAIKTQSSPVPIDKESLLAFLQTSALTLKMDRDIAKVLDLELIPDLAENYAAMSVSRLQLIGIGSISQLENALRDREVDILKCASAVRLAVPKRGANIPKGISFFYLCYSVLISKGSREDLAKFLIDGQVGSGNGAIEFAQKLFDAYNLVPDS